jgi:uncharacterized protein (TIGR02118 family)
MAKLLVLYKIPTDTVAFDAYYANTHIPLAKKVPGLKKYTVSQGPVVTPTGLSAYHLVAELHFEDLEAAGAAFASPEGQAAGADVANFATGGAEMLIFDSHEV